LLQVAGIKVIHGVNVMEKVTQHSQQYQLHLNAVDVYSTHNAAETDSESYFPTQRTPIQCISFKISYTQGNHFGKLCYNMFQVYT